MNVRNSLVEQNLGLVWKAVRYFEARTQRELDRDDLFQTGCIGLIKAAEKYDESLGYKFSTYAFPNIIGEIKTALRDNRTVRIGRSMQQLVAKAAEAQERLQAESGRAIGIAELAEHMGCDREELAMALSADRTANSVTSITALAEADQDKDPRDSEEDWAAEIDLKERLAQLSDDEKRLFRLRYLKGYSQTETAKIMNTSQAGISRMERAMLRRIRNST